MSILVYTYFIFMAGAAIPTATLCLLAEPSLAIAVLLILCGFHLVAGWVCYLVAKDDSRIVV